jgi:6-phosphogluconolactonase (cycloisomerase 2 family)
MSLSFIRNIILIILLFFLQNCLGKLDFNNPGDTRSNAFLLRDALSTILGLRGQLPLLETTIETLSGEVPESLAALILRDSVTVGVRVYPVDPNTGNLGSNFQEYTRTPSETFAPGNKPVKILRVPGTKELLVNEGFNSAGNNRIFTFKVNDDGSVSTYLTSAGHNFGIKNVAISSDGTKIVGMNVNSPNNEVIRYSRNTTTGVVTFQNSGGYPFGTNCGPRSLAMSQNGSNLFVNGQLALLYGFTDSSGTLTQAPGSPFTLPQSISDSDNICIHPTKSFLYTTVLSTTGPIVGYSYGTDSSLTALSSSPFSPSATYTSTAYTPASDTNYISPARTMIIDPRGKFIAFAYLDNTDYKLQLFNIDENTGALTATNNAVTVGNMPTSLAWDESGRFIYFTSKGAGNYQIEVYRVSSNGTLTKAPNSPFSVTSIAGTGALPIGLTSITKSSRVKIGEYP